MGELLRTEGLSKRFRGLIANDNIDSLFKPARSAA